jgi:hypothetical protein
VGRFPTGTPRRKDAADPPKVCPNAATPKDEQKVNDTTGESVMTQQIILAAAVLMMTVLSACGNTTVTNYGGVRGNGYFQGGTMGGMEAQP